MPIAQVDPNAGAVLEFSIRQFGPTATIVFIAAGCFFWFLQKYHARQLESFNQANSALQERLAGSQKDYQDQLERLVKRFDAMSLRQEASLRDFEGQLRDSSKEHTATVANLERTVISLQATMTSLGNLVNRIVESGAGLDVLRSEIRPEQS